MAEGKKYKAIKIVGKNVVLHDQLWDPEQVEERVQKRPIHSVRVIYLLIVYPCFCKTCIHTILDKDSFKRGIFLSTYMLKEANKDTGQIKLAMFLKVCISLATFVLFLM